MLLTDEEFTGKKSKDYEHKERGNFKRGDFNKLRRPKSELKGKPILDSEPPIGRQELRDVTTLYNRIKNTTINVRNNNYNFGKNITNEVNGIFRYLGRLHNSFYFQTMGMDEKKADSGAKKILDRTIDLFNAIYDKIVNNGKENMFFNYETPFYEQY
jgi:hypothetical protein